MNGLKWILALLVVSAVSHAADMDAKLAPETAAMGHAEQLDTATYPAHPEAQTQANLDRRLLEYTNACLLARPADQGIQNIPVDRPKLE